MKMWPTWLASQCHKGIARLARGEKHHSGGVVCDGIQIGLAQLVDDLREGLGRRSGTIGIALGQHDL
ncbi:MAG: hypothetical protein ACOYXM_16870 [Actinomycetota bacterium]